MTPLTPYPKAKDVQDEVYTELTAQLITHVAGAQMDPSALERAREFMLRDIIGNPGIEWGGRHKQQLMWFGASVGAIAAADARMSGGHIDYDTVDAAIRFLVPAWENVCELPAPPNTPPDPSGRIICLRTRQLLDEADAIRPAAKPVPPLPPTPSPPANEVPDQVYTELTAQFMIHVGSIPVDPDALARARRFIVVDVLENPRIKWGGTHKQQLLRFAAYVGATAAAEARAANSHIDWEVVSSAITFLVPAWEAVCQLPPKPGHEPEEGERILCEPTRAELMRGRALEAVPASR